MGPLTGLVVLDLTRVLTGPYCTMMLADQGARVIKVESPQGDETRGWGPPFVDGESTYFLSVNRGKESVVVDLKHPDGQEVVRRIARGADVVVENFRPGQLDAFNLAYPRLRALNPRIILASISGFGQTGPDARRPGYDVIAQGMSGFMSVTGYPGEPPVKAGFSIGDLSAGMWAAFGILAALHQRERTGEGAWIETSLLDALLSWQTYQGQAFLATGKSPGPLGTAHPSIAPYQTFRARDGYVNIAVGNERLWGRFCHALGQPGWLEDPRFRTNRDRVVHRDALVAEIHGVLAEDSVAAWVERLDAAEVPCGPVLDLAGVFAHPHVQAREVLMEVVHPRAGRLPMVRPAIRTMGEADPAPSLPPPLAGQHTRTVLASLGYGAAEIEALIGSGAVGAAD